MVSLPFQGEISSVSVRSLLMGLESPVRGKGQGRLRQITSVAKTHLGTMFGGCVFSLG